MAQSWLSYLKVNNFLFSFCTCFSRVCPSSDYYLIKRQVDLINRFVLILNIEWKAAWTTRSKTKISFVIDLYKIRSEICFMSKRYHGTIAALNLLCKQFLNTSVEPLRMASMIFGNVYIMSNREPQRRCLFTIALPGV